MMRQDQGFRVQDMLARTSKTGADLTITSKRGRVTLSEFEADRLCRWMIALFEIDVALEEAALGRLARSLEQLTAKLGRMFDQRIAAENAAAAARWSTVPPSQRTPVPKRKSKRLRLRHGDWPTAKKRVKRKAKAHK